MYVHVFMSVCWTLFKSANIWDYFDLDCILQKGIFCLNLSIITDILGWNTYHRSFFIENLSINVEFLNNKTGETTAGVNLVSINEIVSYRQQIGTRALLIVNN